MKELTEEQKKNINYPKVEVKNPTLIDLEPEAKYQARRIHKH